MENLIQQIVTETGLPKDEAYYFLVRLGQNYRDDYPHRFWEPFRDLAGPLRQEEDSLPIVYLSRDGPETPRVSQQQSPEPHFRIEVSPACDGRAIAEAWSEALVDARAIPSEGGLESNGWFLDEIGCRIEELSAKAQSFFAG